MEKESDLIRVFTGSEVAVLLLKAELEEIEILAMLQNDFDSGLSAGFSGGVPSAVDLYIQKSDLSRAEPILTEFIKNNEG